MNEQPTKSISFADWLPEFQAAGFPYAGAVDFDLAEDLYQEHALRYQDWIQAKKQGAMGYLERGLERRLNPKLVFPELKSVIAVLKPYSAHAIEKNGLRYARYLNGPDYHDAMKIGLEKVFDDLKHSQKLPSHFDYKICVDTSAVLERTWAALCGLGWIGKNTLLIHPQLGSYVFLGVVFTNIKFGNQPLIVKDYCGHCTRCLSACPTDALSTHDLNSNQCISYLTLEKRGEWEQKYPLKGFLAGCDLCQEVCPYNTKPERYQAKAPVLDFLELNPDVLLQESESDYQARVKSTALSRIKYSDFRRNLKSVLSSEK